MSHREWIERNGRSGGRRRQKKFTLLRNRRKKTMGRKESEECPEACWYTEAGEEPVYKCRHHPCPVFVGWTSTRQRGQEEDQLPWWNINLAETRLSRMSRWMKLSWASIPIPLNGKEKLLAEQIVLFFFFLTSSKFPKKKKRKYSRIKERGLIT